MINTAECICHTTEWRAFFSSVNGRGHSSFINMASLSLMSLTPSALLCSKANIARVYSWYANTGHFKRLSGWHFQESCSLPFTRSLSSWVTVALLWPSLLHLSPCQDSSFIYRKAFTQINTATQQLPRTHTHTRRRTQAFFSHRHAPRFWLMIRAKQNTAVLGSPVCLIPVFLSVDRFRSTHLAHFSSTSFLIAFPPSSVFSLLYLCVLVRKQWPELEGWSEVEGEGTTGRELKSPSLSLSPSPPTANRCVWVSPCGRGPGGLKGEPSRAFPFLHEGTEKTSRPKPGRLASHWRTLHLSAELSLPISSPPHLLPLCLQHPLTGEALEDTVVHTHFPLLAYIWIWVFF